LNIPRADANSNTGAEILLRAIQRPEGGGNLIFQCAKSARQMPGTGNNCATCRAVIVKNVDF
jgi:hypothetical protein